MERFVIQFESVEEPEEAGDPFGFSPPASTSEYFEAESFEAAVLVVADRIRAFDFGGKTVRGLGTCLRGYDAAA